MVKEVILPKLGQTMIEGTIVEWFKKEGDPVKRGDLLFTVESDKATLEVTATSRGFLRKILVPAGETKPVMAVVALMTRTADEDMEGYQVEGLMVQRLADQDSTIESEVFEPVIRRPATDRIFASPRARKLARERGVNLARVGGTGPNGRIVERDVQAFLALQPKTTPMALKAATALGVDIAAVSGTGVSGRITKTDIETAARVFAAAPPVVSPVEPLRPTVAPIEVPVVEAVPLTGLRRVIAQRMAASARETAHVTLVTEVDATALVQVREQLKADVAEEWGFAPGYNDLLGLIVARALREFPYMNARLSADGTDASGDGVRVIERLSGVNLGLAVDTERGLLVPVIRNADQKGLRAFGTEFRALMERARTGKSLPDDLSGGTFTVTNLGMYEVDAFTPVINLPEAAILGVGRIQPKPVVRDGEVVVRQILTLSLAFDHRLVDGAPAARFLQRIKRFIENPYLLLG